MKRKLLVLIICLSSAISIYSQETEKYVLLGDKAIKSGHHDVAINNYLKAIEINPNHKKAYIKLSAIVDSTKWEDGVGITVYNDACEIIKTYIDNCRSTNNEFYIKMGDFFYENYTTQSRLICFDPDQAMNLYNKALIINPNSAKTYARMGLASREIEYFIKSLDIGPFIDRAFINAIGFYQYNKDFDDCILFCQNLLKKYTNAVVIYEYMGMIYFNKGCYSKNKEDYINSIKSLQNAKVISLKTKSKLHFGVAKINSMINNSTYNLGHTYFEEGKYKNAINCFNKITESLINANQNLGTSYFYIKDYANAIYFWKKYIARLEAINSDENIEEIERVKDYIEQAKEKLVENGNLQQNTNQLNLKPTKRGGLTKDPNFKLK